MKISSNSLFHFTSKKKYLKDILENGFWPRYCREYGWGNIDFAIPMVCFCDIPLTQVLDHTSTYGQYGLGLNRKWITSNRSITPVHYIKNDSEIFSHINRLLKKIQDGESLTDDEYHCLMFAKKVSGNEKYRTKNIQKKLFYNEREWRYASYKKLGLSPSDYIILIDKDEEFDANPPSLNTFNNRINIDTSDIQYILIPKESNRKDMIKTIMGIKKFNNNQITELISKIISIEQIKNDF